MQLEPLAQSACLIGREGFVKRGFLVGIELVHHQHDFLRFWQQVVGEMVETGGEIQRCAAAGAFHKNNTFSQIRHGDHNYAQAAITDIFVVFPGQVARWPGIAGTGALKGAYGQSGDIADIEFITLEFQ